MKAIRKKEAVCDEGRPNIQFSRHFKRSAPSWLARWLERKFPVEEREVYPSTVTETNQTKLQATDAELNTLEVLIFGEVLQHRAKYFKHGPFLYVETIGLEKSSVRALASFCETERLEMTIAARDREVLTVLIWEYPASKEAEQNTK